MSAHRVERTDYVEFGMYRFPPVLWAWDELWAAVQARVPWAPARSVQSADTHAAWSDDDCIVTQVCGWPFISQHLRDLQPIGAFELDISEAQPNGRYRSVLLSPHDVPLDELVEARCHVAANSADSLSGWLSLCAATVGPGVDWPGRVTFTSAHIHSVQALADRKADLASIDSWSLAFIEAEQPELFSDLHRVGFGPVTPTPLIAARSSVDSAHVDELRRAFVEAITDPVVRPVIEALHISGFAELTLDDYLALEPLAPPS